MHNEFEDDDFHFDNEDEDELGDYIVGTQRMPRHQLRSRPPIDFDDARHSTVSTNVGLPAFTAATYPLSRMSGSTLHSGLAAMDLRWLTSLMGQLTGRISHNSWAANVSQHQRFFHISWASRCWLRLEKLL